MLADIKRATGSVGLALHPDKTNIFTNASQGTGRPTDTQAQVDDISVEILADSATIKYLGRLVTCECPNDVELANRMRKAWSAFASHKHELTSIYYPLKDRIKLFNSVVTPSMLYGNEVWPMTKDTEMKITRVQRRMLRQMVQARRRVVPHDCSKDVDSNPGSEGTRLKGVPSYAMCNHSLIPFDVLRSVPNHC